MCRKHCAYMVLQSIIDTQCADISNIVHIWSHAVSPNAQCDDIANIVLIWSYTLSPGTQCANIINIIQKPGPSLYRLTFSVPMSQALYTSGPISSGAQYVGIANIVHIWSHTVAPDPQCADTENVVQIRSHSVPSGAQCVNITNIIHIWSLTL